MQGGWLIGIVVFSIGCGKVRGWHEPLGQGNDKWTINVVLLLWRRYAETMELKRAVALTGCHMED